jgi:uncharacterized protein YdcH (DUF465 family)
MTAKQWLGRARNIDREIDNLIREKQRTKDRLTKITQSYESDGAQMTKDPHKFDRLAELENEIDQQVDELVETKREIIAVIQRLKNRPQRMALQDYYIAMMTWEETAVDLHYSFQGVMQLRKRAIAEVEKLINP